MLTSDDIHTLAESKDLPVICTWEASTTGRQLPTLKSMRIRFKTQEPEIWFKLVTSSIVDVHLDITGTRQVTSSGATDNTLYDCYADLLKEVNAKRLELGYAAIHR